MFRPLIDTIMTKSAFRAFRHRDFAIVEAAGWLAGAGVWFYRIGLSLLAWQLTKSGWWLGVIAIAEAGPGILISPIAGALVDRHDRLMMAKIVQFAMMAVTGILAVMTFAGLIDIWMLTGFAVLHGICTGFWTPVRMSIAPNLVPREDLSSTIASHSILFNLGRTLGPALVVLPIIEYWEVGGVFAVNAAANLVFCVALFAVTLVNPDRKAAAGRSMRSHLVEGLRYAAAHPVIKYLFLNMIFASLLLRAYMELLPGLSETVFGYDPKEGVPLLVAAAGVGAVIASLLVGSLRNQMAILNAYLASVFGSLVFLALFVSTSNFWFALICTVFLSTAQVGVNIAGQVTVQGSVRGDLRGRVMSLWGLLNRSGPAVGALLMGGLSGYWGFTWPMLAGVAISAVVALFVFSRRDAMRLAVMEHEKSQVP
ncbi:MAG: MFS transporter [Alphaproteobacteria bacterium]|nr:MFS transporter [Alphaproteobacteria bacterium]